MRKCMTTVAVAAVVLACGLGVQANVVIDTVPVANPGNAGELSGAGAGGYGPDAIVGGVDYTYNIGKYEVTNSQYAEFLNAVAASDPSGLYNMDMGGGWNDIGGISRSGSDGSYTYAARSNRGNRPVNYVNWGDSARFANWLHNGQPTGPQGLTTTEDGAYLLNGATSNAALLAVSREVDWRWAITSEDEWYKAAYYKGDGTNAGYWDYPTASDTVPTAEAPPGADMINGSANYDGGGGYVDPTYYTTQVGAYTAKPSDSAYSTFDQGGNLWEWNEAVLYGSQRGVRGGSYATNDDNPHAANRYNGGPPADEYYIGVGFRVAEVPEPTTMVMLAFGTVLMLHRGRGRG